jgi:hypothetical protein
MSLYKELQHIKKSERKVNAFFSLTKETHISWKIVRLGPKNFRLNWRRVATVTVNQNRIKLNGGLDN